MKRLLFSVLVLALPLLVGSAALAELPKPGGTDNLITMNFQDVDISVLAKFISEITGKNFILDESVRGKVSIVSPTKVTPEQAYSIFKSVLQLKGFTTVGAGPVIKIDTVARYPGSGGTDAFPATRRAGEYRRVRHPHGQAAQR